MNLPFVSPAAVADLSDEEWLALLCKSLDSPDVEGSRFPLFPPEETQQDFVGMSGREALGEAVRFVRYAVDAMDAVGRAPSSTSSVVDFGSGWGRITRALLRFFEPDRVVGVDPLESMVAASRTWFEPSPVRFETTGTWPPLPSQSDSVDLIVAYSVFSHLPRNLSTAWMAEFLRVLKPGGLVVATTQSRSFIDLCEQMRAAPEYRDSDFLWYQLLARSFIDADEARRRFDAGEYLHEANGAGDALAEAIYGDSLFGQTFVDDQWGHLLELLRFDDKPNGLPQACFVLRKRDAGGSSPSRRELNARARAAVLEEQLRAMEESWAWRIGRTALAPVRGARRIRRNLPDRPHRQRRPAGQFVPYSHAGFCPACNHDTTFVASGPWLRDDYRCRRCASLPRQRALASVLRELRPAFAELVIHESSPTWVGISAYLRDHCPHYIPSYCWPGQPLGQEVGGYRNEDLEHLTFDDGSIDVHVSQDVMEHVFDLDAAAREIERTLKPGGLHVFTTPIVNRSGPSVQRARRDETGAVVHLAPPAFHGNPIDESGSLVTFDFGYDLPHLIGRATHMTTSVFVLDNADQGIRGEYLEVCVSAKDGLPLTVSP